MKEILFNPQEKLLEGFNKGAEAIAVTLGPKGRNVAIWSDVTPMVVNDGATIAKECLVSDDPIENFGMWFIRNTTSQSADDAGDGTTTTAVLLQALVREARKFPDPVEAANSLLEAYPKVLKKIHAKKLKDNDVYPVALVSAEHEGLARVITKIVKERGKDLLFLVEDNREGEDIQVEAVSGYEAHIGWALPIFITDRARARAVHEMIPVLVSEKKISNLAEVKPIFDQLQANSVNKVCIVCYDIDEAMLGVFAATHLQRRMTLLVVKATGPLLEDIAGTVGATRVSDQEGVPFHKFDISKHLGWAQKIVSDENKTLFVPQDKKKSQDYSNILESRALNEFNMFRKDKLLERVHKIRSGVAVIKVGAPTDLEREYLKLKADDAAKAVKCAFEEGIVEGGGMCLWRIAQEMKPKTIGETILKRSLIAPLQRICANGGVDYAEIAGKMPENMGYNAKTHSYVNMIEGGIIDPAKVERVALTNAASTAAKFITIEAAAYPLKKDK